MSLTILAIGKKHESWVQSGIERYEKRCKQPWNAKWILLPHSSFEGTRARQDESERLLAHIHPGDFVILLDERGKNIDSPALSTLISEKFTYSTPVVIVIGGAYGVSEQLFARASFTWSLSKLVFPHQLVRLILAEQLYRAQEIALGHPYHHQ